jgi:hypothetical protein
MLSALPLALLLLALQDDDAPEWYNRYKGKAPPDLVSSKEHWLNSKPLTFEKLKGRVILLEISTVG